MQYFNTLPKIIQTDNVGTSRVFTNLMARASIIPKVLKDPLVYYSYDIQDGDTPEIIADKYYNDSYRYWIFLFANQMMDPQWQMPLSSSNFQYYLESKYKDMAAENDQTVLEYIKTTVAKRFRVVQTVDNTTQTTAIDKFEVDSETYDFTPEYEEVTNFFPDGSSVTTTIGRESMNLYEYELEQNEAKRTVNIVNSDYTTEFENQFVSLMRR